MSQLFWWMGPAPNPQMQPCSKAFRAHRPQARLRCCGRAGPWLFRRLSRASPRLEAPDLEDAGMDVATEMVFLGGDEEECASPRAAAPAAPPDEADEGEEDDAPAVESNVEQRRVRPISIGFTRLSVYVRPSMKPILSGVTGRFRSGAYESRHAAGAPRARFV